MADDLQNYKLQLQQVEVALLSDPENQELLKLKKDLDEVIELTRDLIKTQLEEQKKSSYIGPDTEKPSSSLYDDDIEQVLRAAERIQADEDQKAKWKIGDKCQAKWTEDGQYYDATIEGITVSGEVSVIFEAYQNRSTTTLRELRERQARNEVFPSSSSNKRRHPNQKEYLKKKKMKKQQRFKELEQERETEKNKWLAFTTKSAKKSGGVPKSIFASPDNVNGRVGIGTCGVAGKPMTETKTCEKWRKGA
ncbi:survival of motor neuron-related-splicing factor 30 [Lutzomyia longipalpis]|nr:survival of motor neuron-related-splicing factor 30 [Lutzomyia longipalpis]